MRFGYLYNFGITSSPTHHYQCDDVGNRTSVLDLGVTKSYGANSVNAYTSISGFAAPVHDANGNMNSGPLGVVGAGTSALTYGKENNNLLSALGTQATNFVYDAMGRLGQFSYTENSVTKTEILTWAGWTLMSREIFTGNTVSETFRYTWGTDLSGTMEGAGGVGGMLAVERNVAGSNTWDIRYTHADANGNIIALTNSSGNVSARYRYDAFGKVLSATDVDNTGWVNHNIHGFSSKPSFGNQGLLYYGYRWYSPSLGRWINRDPIEENGGMNLYGFVGNDGVNLADVLGLCDTLYFKGWYHSLLAVKDEQDMINMMAITSAILLATEVPGVVGSPGSSSVSNSMLEGMEEVADMVITGSDVGSTIAAGKIFDGLNKDQKAWKIEQINNNISNIVKITNYHQSVIKKLNGNDDWSKSLHIVISCNDLDCFGKLKEKFCTYSSTRIYSKKEITPKVISDETKKAFAHCKKNMK